jgi:O-antigen ligase
VLVLGGNIAWTVLNLGGALVATRAVTLSLTALLLVLHACDPSRGGRAHRAGLLFLPFLAYAAWNVAWVTPVGWLGWIDWFNWLQAVVVFWIVLNGVPSGSCRRALWVFLAGAACASAVLAAYQHFGHPKWLMLGRKQVEQYLGRSAGSFGNPNNLGALMVLLIPPAGYVAFARASSAKARVAAAAGACVLAMGFVFAVSRGGWLSLAGAFALAPLLIPGERASRRIARAFTALALAAAAAALMYASFPIMRVRLHQFLADSGERTRPIVWSAAWHIFTAHPFFGSGGGSYDTMFEPFRPAGFLNRPEFAHCEYLNTLSDFGGVGFVLLFGASLCVALRWRSARGFHGAAAVGLLAFALDLLVDFHLRYPSLPMAFAAVGALVTSEVWPEGAANSAAPGGRGGAFVRLAAIGAAAAIVFFALPKFRAEGARWLAREKIDLIAQAPDAMEKLAPVLSEARPAFARAVQLDPSNAQAWSDLAYADSLVALTRKGEDKTIGEAVEKEADKALALSQLPFEFWIRKGTGLDMQGKWVEGGACFTRALRLAPNRPAAWYYEGYHFSLNPVETGMALASVDACLRLDPGFLLAQILRQRLEQRLH